MTSLTLQVRPDAVALLTIDQPDSKVNILTEQLVTDLGAAVDSLVDRTDLRGLIVASAKPGNFIAGADLRVFAAAAAPNDPTVRAFIDRGLRVLEKLESLPFATCAAIDGAALGGGLEVALACDFRFGGTNARLRLGLPEVTLGLIPGWGGTQRLPRLIALERAMEMLVTGTPLDAGVALTDGLLNGRIESERLIDSAARYLTQTAYRPAREARLRAYPDVVVPPGQPTDSIAAREAHRVVEQGLALPLGEAIPHETEAFLQLAGSPESMRLIAEFFASRKK